MKRARTTALLTATTVLAVLGPVLATAAPATAADAPGSTEVAIYLAAGEDGSYGIYRRPTAGGPAVELVAPSDSADRYDLRVSQDGSRFAYGEDVYDPETGEPLRERIVVRDVNGPFRRNVVDRAYAEDDSISEPALSPDGRTVVWSRVTGGFANPSLTLYASSVFGSPRQIAGSTGLVDATFVSPTRLMATIVNLQTGATSLRSIPLAGGPQTTVNFDGVEGFDYHVSPAGDQVLFSEYQDLTDQLVVRWRNLAVDGSSVTLTNTVEDRAITAGDFDFSPSWRRDGLAILLTRAPVGNEQNGDVYTAPLSHDTDPAPLFEPTPTVDEFEVAVGRIDAVAPGAVTSTSPATLSGTTARIPLDAVPADSDWSGTYVRRTTGGVTRTTLVPVGTAVADTGLVVGTTYSYTFAAVDSSGNIGAWSAPRLVTGTAAPVLTTADPTSTTSVRASFPVTLSAVNAPSTTYFVAYGRNAAPTVLWLNGMTGGTQVFGSGAAAGRAATTSVPGSTYQFLAVARDTHGNSTGLVKAARYAVVPFDNGSLTPAGATQTVPRTGAYGGTSLFLKAAGAQGAIRIAGNRVQVIGERGPTTGRFVVYDNGVRVAVVDTRAASRQTRQVLFARTLSTTTNHTIVVRAEGTAGRPTVVLDGLSTRRF